ncbi:N5,N10-methylene tetrahydromethanopterin reductase [Microbacterium sp. Root61]|uniref:LLM class flavin-dependent oxidoreductase n=1 Tax=Microbacterium sp. Root61 TaxID=1736570 RepID=UPI0006F38F3F|nr:LLM class flavin-dependent oxidoreductase [Microbacterium sp. Root61]KRA23966.1 N5,N10-methylene tetrahydromethanopterin reductase [Microbacterium sp. Root61]
MTVRRGNVSIGIAGALGADAARIIAPAVEQAGFHALWVNDTPGADSLEVLAAAAAITTSLVLATGVIPLDRRPADDVAAAVAQRGLPSERLVLGVGAGGARVGALALVEEGVRTLQDRTGARVFVGALGPRMRRLAVDHADGVLLSWLSPAAAAEQARESGDAEVALYARTALDPAAVARRDEEAHRYAGYPAYAANFARLALDPLDTLLPLPGDAGIGPGVAAYAAVVDDLVLRAITPADTVEEYLRFIEQARVALAVTG